MEKLRGVVSNVRTTIDVGGDAKHVTTTHIAMFEVNGAHAMISESSPIVLKDGDEVVLVGDVKKGVFKALAFKNLTARTDGAAGNWIFMAVFGVVFTAAGAGAITTFSNPFFGLMPKLIGGGFVVAGCYIIYSGMRTLKAVRML